MEDPSNLKCGRKNDFLGKEGGGAVNKGLLYNGRPKSGTFITYLLQSLKLTQQSSSLYLISTTNMNYVS